MIKIENRSPEDIAKYGRRIGEAFAASPGIAETIPHDDLIKSFEIITEFYYRMGTLYATSEKYEGFLAYWDKNTKQPLGPALHMIWRMLCEIPFKSLLNTNKTSAKISKIAIKLIDILEKDIKKALASSKKDYLQPCDIWHLEDKVKDVLSIGNQTGEGWFLTAEMIEYMEHDIPNIICVQPFACLPNHVVGKGVIKTIREKYPEANISPVDYDPGASETNQANRIKLLMTVAKDNLARQENEKKALDGENNNKETVLL